MILRRAALSCILLFSALTGPARSDGQACSLALAFALDVSVSVDAAEYRLQREGLAAALTDPDIAGLIVAQPGVVSLMAYEWSGSRQQTVIVPWSRIAAEADLARFAARLRAPPLPRSTYPTALGRAAAFGLTNLAHQSDCSRRVLDISGDGPNNDGFPPQSAYKHFPVAGVTVNGLVVGGIESGALPYYLENVILGAGAFVETAASFTDYAEAMKRKLLREIEGRPFAKK